jgi:hypothetical protein
MALRKAIFPAILVGLAIVPTLIFSNKTKATFERAFVDAGLLQTSRLDGWDKLQTTSQAQREEYRRWLVDCHKASFVPVCLAGSDNLLTVEPAAVVSSHRGETQCNFRDLTRQKAQRGAVFHRHGSDDRFFRKKKNPPHLAKF